MRPFYITTGHATNSSSSHSVMLLRDAFRKLFPMLETDDIPDREGFIDGGAHFLLTTREEKRRYVVGRILEGLDVLGDWGAFELALGGGDGDRVEGSTPSRISGDDWCCWLCWCITSSR